MENCSSPKQEKLLGHNFLVGCLFLYVVTQGAELYMLLKLEFFMKTWKLKKSIICELF